MATIKLEILLDSNDQTDVLAFSNLMNAFSGTPAVQVLHPGDAFPTIKMEGLSNPLENPNLTVTKEQSTADAGDHKEETAETPEYTEAEMLKLPNTDLKEYATGLGIDWAKAEGKNTNRKLADLVLAFRSGETSEEQETPAAEAAKDEAPAETTEDLTKEDDLAGEGITYNDLKVSLGKKVDEHREAIVAKLAEYGATKMPNLAEEHWTAMFNFMEAL